MPTKGNVTRPRIEPMLMIRPSCCCRMEGRTARVARSSPMTLVSKIAFACSVVKASVTPTEAIPALLTSTSILPASVSTVLTPASTDVSSRTSSSSCMTQLAAEPLECAFLGVDLRRLQPALAQVSDLERERLDLPDEPSELTFATGRVHH